MEYKPEYYIICGYHAERMPDWLDLYFSEALTGNEWKKAEDTLYVLSDNLFYESDEAFSEGDFYIGEALLSKFDQEIGSTPCSIDHFTELFNSCVDNVKEYYYKIYHKYPKTEPSVYIVAS